MNGLPYYKAYPRDFMEATVGWPLDLKGAYRLILDLIYMHNGRLPDDPRFISGHLGCSVRAWGGYKKTLIEKGKISLNDGLLSNYRADNELIITRSFQDKQRQNGSELKKNKDLGEAVAKPKANHTEPEPYIDDDDGSASVRKPEICHPEPDTLRSKILTAIGADPISGIAGPSLFLGTQNDMMTVNRWQSDLGLTEPEILAQIADVTAKARQKNASFVPSRFAYFDRPMAELAGMKTAPQMQPTQTERGQNGQNYNDKPSGQSANRHGAGLTAGFAAVANRISAGS